MRKTVSDMTIPRSWSTCATLRVGLLLAAGLMAMGGCGVYTASTGRVDERIQRVAVQYLENLTPEPNIGVDLTNAIIRALQIDNTLKIVDEGASDSIISGQVTRYALKEVAARSEDLTVNEYQVQIAVKLTFTVRATGETLFKDRRFTGVGNYVLDDPNGTTEETARSEAAEEIVKDILALVVEDW